MAASTLCTSSCIEQYERDDVDRRLALLRAVYATTANRADATVHRAAATFLDVPPAYVAQLLVHERYNICEHKRGEKRCGKGERLCALQQLVLTLAVTGQRVVHPLAGHVAVPPLGERSACTAAARGREPLQAGQRRPRAACQL